MSPHLTAVLAPHAASPTPACRRTRSVKIRPMAARDRSILRSVDIEKVRAKFPSFPAHSNAQKRESFCADRFTVVITFLTANDATPSEVYWWGPTDAATVATGTVDAYSQLLYLVGDVMHPEIGAPALTAAEVRTMQDTQDWALRTKIPPFFRTASYNVPREPPREPKLGSLAYKNPASYYMSPLIHSVTLTGLTPGTTYGYRVAGDLRNFSFTMPPDAGSAAYPMTFALTADLGQTAASRKTAAFLRTSLEAAEPHAGVTLLAGDLSYADGYAPRWDTWGTMMEPLASQVPLMTTGGNHEVMAGEDWLNYNARYKMPFRSSSSPTNLWWSRSVGPVHIIALCRSARHPSHPLSKAKLGREAELAPARPSLTYAISLCSYAPTAAGSLQYRWLERDLAAVDRTATPWLVAMFHAPWYNSNSGHQGEAELMRLDMETLFFNYSVDMVLTVTRRVTTQPLNPGTRTKPSCSHARSPVCAAGARARVRALIPRVQWLPKRVRPDVLSTWRRRQL